MPRQLTFNSSNFVGGNCHLFIHPDEIIRVRKELEQECKRTCGWLKKPKDKPININSLLKAW